MGQLLMRGMLAGLLAALLAFSFAKVYGEPQVDRAIAFEEHEHSHSGNAEEPALVSREVQASIGLLTGVAVYGTALGGLFALAFAFISGRLLQLPPRATALIVAALAIPRSLHCALSQVSGESTRRRRRGYDRLQDAALLHDAGILSRCAGDCHCFRPPTLRQARRLERDDRRLLGLPRACRNSCLRTPGNQRGSRDFPGRSVVEFPEFAAFGTQAILWAVIGFAFGALVERSQASVAH